MLQFYLNSQGGTVDARHYRPGQPPGSLHLSDILNIESNSGPEKECQLPEVTQHQGSDTECRQWKPCESCQNLPELVLPHVVDVQGLFPLRQNPEFHLPTSLSLPTLLFCLEGEESQARDGTWRLSVLAQCPSSKASASTTCKEYISALPLQTLRGPASVLLPQI